MFMTVLRKKHTCDFATLDLGKRWGARTQKIFIRFENCLFLSGANWMQAIIIEENQKHLWTTFYLPALREVDPGHTADSAIERAINGKCL